MDEKICYKVTLPNGMSMIAKDDFAVSYRIGSVSRAPEELAEMGNHLLVFKTMEHALYQLPLDREVKVWKAKCRGQAPIPHFSMIPTAKRRPGRDSIAALREYLNKYSHSLPDDRSMAWPAGTLCFEEVELVEDVSREMWHLVEKEKTIRPAFGRRPICIAIDAID